MQIQEAIKTINAMHADGVIDTYAIGGAVGATFYLEPVATVDIDVFAAFNPGPASKLISLQPVFDYLKARGFRPDGEYIIIAGWPVQFLPPTSKLVDEALREAVVRDVDGTPARVFTAEHLAAIALETGRAADKARLLQFIEAGAFDSNRFQQILSRHQLQPKWQQFAKQFLGDA
jgi:hypothetical protein